MVTKGLRKGVKELAPDTRKGGDPHLPHWQELERIDGNRRDSEVEELPDKFGRTSEPLPPSQWLAPTDQDDPTDEIDEIEEMVIGRTEVEYRKPEPPKPIWDGERWRNSDGTLRFP